MTEKRAWVTLATNDSYALGALVLANSLKLTSTVHELAILITPGVSPSMKEELNKVFNKVKEVDVLDSKDAANLALLARPELGVTFTKIHSWNLTEYSKCVFLDADTLVIQNADELLEREELSAAPDAGWPDCFNSGVFVFKPNAETFKAIVDHAVAKGSFDGGDQGLLNTFFSDWATKDIQKHLPFVYNMVCTSTYSYLPAHKFYGDKVKIVHFIGVNKPWLQCEPSSPTLTGYLDLWWKIFNESVSKQLKHEMINCSEDPLKCTTQSPERHKFSDPWEELDVRVQIERSDRQKNQENIKNNVGFRNTRSPPPKSIKRKHVEKNPFFQTTGDTPNNRKPLKIIHNSQANNDNPKNNTDMSEQNGLAGALAVGQRPQIEEEWRKQNWEQGIIDYQGKDSFENIWKKISKTLGLPEPVPQAPKEVAKAPEAPKDVPVASEQKVEEPKAEVKEAAKTEASAPAAQPTEVPVSEPPKTDSAIPDATQTPSAQDAPAQPTDTAAPGTPKTEAAPTEVKAPEAPKSEAAPQPNVPAPGTPTIEGAPAPEVAPPKEVAATEAPKSEAAPALPAEAQAPGTPKSETVPALATSPETVPVAPEVTPAPGTPKTEAAPAAATPQAELAPAPVTEKTEAQPAPVVPQAEATPAPATPQTEAAPAPVVPQAEATPAPSTPQTEAAPAPVVPEDKAAPAPSAPQTEAAPAPVPQAEATPTPVTPQTEAAPAPVPQAEATPAPSTPQTEVAPAPAVSPAEAAPTPSTPQTEAAPAPVAPQTEAAPVATPEPKPTDPAPASETPKPEEAQKPKAEEAPQVAQDGGKKEGKGKKGPKEPKVTEAPKEQAKTEEKPTEVAKPEAPKTEEAQKPQEQAQAEQKPSAPEAPKSEAPAEQAQPGTPTVTPATPGTPTSAPFPEEGKAPESAEAPVPPKRKGNQKGGNGGAKGKAKK